MVVGRLSEEGDRLAQSGHPNEDPQTGTGAWQLGTIVVKIGGSTLGSQDSSLRDVVALQREGVRPVVVHGGGKMVSDWMRRQGVRPRFVRGLRVTDGPSLDVVVAVLTGLVNKSLVAAVHGLGGRAVGLAGVDGGMIEARVADPELGRVGEVVKVDPRPIEAVVDAGYIPIVASVAISSPGGDNQAPGLLNVNADTAAGEIAGAMDAARLVMLTDVEGVFDSSRRLLPRLTRRQARQLMGSNVIAGGMVPKIGACLKALDSVSSAHIVDGRRAGALLDALADVDIGTRVI